MRSEEAKPLVSQSPGDKVEVNPDAMKKEIVKKPPIKKLAPKQQAYESELVSGIQVQDFSHLYKSFYDIFVGQVLEPKTFDL